MAKQFLEETNRNNSEEETSDNNQQKKSWDNIWKLNVKQKLKHFIWKCLSNILLVNDPIFHRISKGIPLCCLCGEGMEIVEHVLFNCMHAKEIWEVSLVKWDGLD